MKTIRVITLIILAMLGTKAYSQEANDQYEHYGRTLNAGVGLVYYGYVGQTVPALHINYEMDVARNFTLAPFLTYFGYQEYSYTSDANFVYQNYYRRSVMPIGLKGTYYFDDLLNANNKWDFYLGASLGAAIRTAVAINGYYDTRQVNRSTTGLYFDGHIGTEYHIDRHIGVTLDLSTGISTVGLAAHL